MQWTYLEKSLVVELRLQPRHIPIYSVDSEDTYADQNNAGA